MNKIYNWIRNHMTDVHALLLWVHICLNKSQTYQSLKQSHKIEDELLTWVHNHPRK